MAKTQQKDLLSRFSDLGSEALQRLQDVPGGSRVVELANESKTRLDEMQKKLRGLDELEKRVAKLEKQLAAQSKPARKTAAKKPAARKPATAKNPAPKNPAT
jgi:predicted phage gp36 major capsid-like protein